ncbi:Cell division cycle-associated protein 4 Hematopoietic progenitor protein [Triplophysa tibetana]|uniref:Cell division cycle-associated protein 4 Hematopoietic progenitor protein n=1 Tax=Triplophysa tibetana TaxID=1572043 RepID=A0A5A9P154_9TELE|nr:Cell division cycle-associated protein 4 Hematopoietic progenitor protein [Triplophysa tibetana]
MVAKGQKRKIHGDYETGGSVWESQLQSVLDISMDKFHRDQALVEPSLLRSVLINNTLRQVQFEVESLSEVGNPKSQTYTELQLESDFSRDSSLMSHNTQTDEDVIAWSSEDEFSLSSAISSILKDLDAVIEAGGPGPCVSQRGPLGSIENVTGDGKFSQSGLKTQRTTDIISSSSKIDMMYPSGLQDVALDKLLLDIDTTVFEPEVNFLQGFSVNADELLKCLPSMSKSSSLDSPSSSINHGQPTWEIHEIEHVMDVLMRTCPQS